MKDLYHNFEIDVPQCWEILKKSSKYCSYYLEEYAKGFFQPPLHFKKASGIDVCGKYNLGGLELRDIQLLGFADWELDPSQLKNCTGLFFDLAKLNPDLMKLGSRISQNGFAYDYILGIASLFNIDDIDFFTGEYSSKYGNDSRNYYSDNPVYLEMIIALNRFGGGNNPRNQIQWIMSPKTMKSVINQINLIMA